MTQVAQKNGVNSKKAEVVGEYNDWPNEAGFESLYEQKTPVELQVQGKIPDYAAGVLYRQGPRSHKVEGTPKGTYKLHHWFDGFQQTHRFELAPSPTGIKVFYNSRLACDRIIQEIEKEGRWNSITFGQKRDPCIGFLGKVMTSFHAVTADRRNIDPAGTNVSVTFSINMPGLPTTAATTKAKGQTNGVTNGITNGAPLKPSHSTGVQSLYSKTDSTSLKQLDPETLEPIGFATQHTLHPDLKGAMSAAHARTDPVTGDLYNFNLDFGRTATYRFFHISAATGKTSILATVSGPGIPAAYIHSLFLTPDYVVLCIWGSHFARNGLSILWHTNALDAIQPTDPNVPARWLVVDRHHGRGLVGEFESPPFFSFHTVNAWQDDSGSIVAELVQYANMDVLHKFYYDAVKSSSPAAHTLAKKKLPQCQAHVKRYRLAADHISATPLNRAALQGRFPKAEEVLAFASGELPTINAKWALREHRYLYSVVDRGLSTFFDGLAKMDLKTGETVHWENEVGHTPSEAIFVADPEGQAEDDGVLLSIVLDGKKGVTYLLVLDAKNMKEVGRAEMDGAMGFGFHGVFGGDIGGAQNY